MDIFDDEMLRLWRSLDQNKVRYIMVGGFATNLHGFSRTTADLDLWIDDNEENRAEIIKNSIPKRLDNLPASGGYNKSSIELLGLRESTADWVDYDMEHNTPDPTYDGKYEIMDIGDLMFLLDNKFISELILFNKY